MDNGVLEGVWSRTVRGFLSRNSSMINSLMASDKTVVVICNGCAVFSCARRDILCMKFKLVAVLEEKINGLEAL